MIYWRVTLCVMAVTVAAQRCEGQSTSVEYDIRDLVAKAKTLGKSDPAMWIVQILADNDLLGTAGDGAVQIRNGHQLMIRARAAGREQVRSLLTALRRLADVAVIVRARLYEVDDTFYARLKNARHVPLEESERQFLAGKAPKDDLFKLLAKEKPVQSGDEAKVDGGTTVALLSRYDFVVCPPLPRNARTGETARQVFREGVGFTVVPDASADRRYVHLRFTEKSSRIEARDKSKVTQNAPPGKKVDAEIVFVEKGQVTRKLLIPDGGSVLVAVQYRPAALAAKGRWWVLAITAQLWIEEEERAIRGQPR